VDETKKRMGDTHNFGRAVWKMDENWLRKPRPLIWEYMFLDQRSGLRRVLDEIGCFPYLPYLTIDPEAGYGHAGRAEILKLSAGDVTPDFSPSTIGEYAGSLIALAVWFGLSDLHCENVLFGVRDGKFILAPVDIECVLDPVHLPTRSFLLAPRSSDVDLCGLSFLFKAPFSPDVAASVCLGYVQALQSLAKHRSRLATEFRLLCDNRDLTTRVLLRSTHEYFQSPENIEALRNKPLLRCEKIQLLRGDVPYYLRDIDSRQIKYFASPDTLEDACLEGRFIVPSLLPVLSNFDQLQAQNLDHWLKIGAMQIATRLLERLDSDQNLHTEYAGLTLKKQSGIITIEYPSLRLVSKGQE
jgi:hypothetical protein